MSDGPLVLKVSRLRPDARLPTKAFPGDMGFDLYNPQPFHAAQEGVYPIHTGLAIELPAGWAALILGRSSLAMGGIFPIGGCIDPGYRGEWVVNLKVSRHSSRYFEVGDKIAQFVLIPVPRAVVVEADDLAPSDRGTKSFGSSGR